MIIQANLGSLFSLHSVMWKLEAFCVLEDNLAVKEEISSVPQENV